MSPIIGLSERVRLPRLGKVRLGIKKEGEKGPYPSATDYFVCPDEIQKVYGDKPKSLKILFPIEDESQFAQQWFKCYSNVRGLICRGNGETAIARVDVKTGEIASRESKNTEIREITCDPENCERFKKKQCRHVMNLQFLLPDVLGFGVYQLDTSSYNSILNVNSGIKFVRSICGRISMIPLTLELKPLEVTPEGTETKKTVHVLNISANYSLAEIQKFAQMPASQILILPPPSAEPPDDLYPDEVISEAPPEPEEAPKPKIKKTAVQTELEKMGAKKVEKESKKVDEPKWKQLGFFSQEEQNVMRSEIFGILTKFLEREELKEFAGSPSIDMTKEELMNLLGKAHQGYGLSEDLEDDFQDKAKKEEFLKSTTGKSSISKLSQEEITRCRELLQKNLEDLPF